MQYRVMLTDKAEADVESVLKWFSDQRATDAGGRWFAQLMTRLDTLEQHPQRCSLAAESEELGEEIRELLVGRRVGQQVARRLPQDELIVRQILVERANHPVAPRPDMHLAIGLIPERVGVSSHVEPLVRHPLAERP